jgi:hypothetical protein
LASGILAAGILAARILAAGILAAGILAQREIYVHQASLRYVVRSRRILVMSFGAVDFVQPKASYKRGIILLYVLCHEERTRRLTGAVILRRRLRNPLGKTWATAVLKLSQASSNCSSLRSAQSVHTQPRSSVSSQWRRCTRVLRAAFVPPSLSIPSAVMASKRVTTGTGSQFTFFTMISSSALSGSVCCQNPTSGHSRSKLQATLLAAAYAWEVYATVQFHRRARHTALPQPRGSKPTYEGCNDALSLRAVSMWRVRDKR